MDDQKVRYGRGLKESYLAIAEKDENKIYICKDTGEIYIGEIQLSSMKQLEDLARRLSNVVGHVGDMDDLQTDAETLVDAINKLLSAGPSGSGDTTDTILVSNDIGRYHAGDEIPAGTGLETIFKGILQKKSNPTITAPKATVTASIPALSKVGTSVNFGTVTVGFSRGSISPAYGTNGYRSGVATEYTLKITSGGATLFEQSNTTGSFTVGNISISGKGVVTLTGTVSYEAGQQPKDSDGDDYDTALAAGSVTDTKTATEFIVPFLYGGSDGANFTNLNQDLSKKGTKTYMVTTSQDKVTFLYDEAYGRLKSITDENGFENIDGFENTSVTVNGLRYYAYVSQYDTSGTATYKISF